MRLNRCLWPDDTQKSTLLSVKTTYEKVEASLGRKHWTAVWRQGIQLDSLLSECTHCNQGVEVQQNSHYIPTRHQWNFPSELC